MLNRRPTRPKPQPLHSYSGNWHRENPAVRRRSSDMTLLLIAAGITLVALFVLAAT